MDGKKLIILGGAALLLLAGGAGGGAYLFLGSEEGVVVNPVTEMPSIGLREATG